MGYDKLNVPYTFTYEIYKGSQGLQAVRDAVVALSAVNTTHKNPSLLELGAGLEMGSDDRMIPTDPSHPAHTEGGVQFNSESLADCFAYFNPTSQDLVETTVTEWAQAMMATAEYFTLKAH